MKTGALIVASLDFNNGNRDNEDMPVFLPMQHLDGTTAIKREIFLLRKAEVTPIIVLCGCEQEVLKNHLSHNGVIFCEDEKFEEHSFEETLQVGMDFAAGLCDRVLIVAVEYPAFCSSTVEKLLECTKSTVPVYQGQRGYPCLHIFSEKERQEKKAQIEPLLTGETEIMEVEDRGICCSLTEENGLEAAAEWASEQWMANALRLKIKVMLTKEEDFFGPGIYNLLRNIDEVGSIQGAAAKMGMSYTKCWKMVNRVERQMGFKFIIRVNGGRNGGSSSLTEEAKLFLDRYKALREDLTRMSQNFFHIYFRDYL